MQNGQGAATKVDVTVIAKRDDSKDQKIAWTLDYRLHPPGHGKASGRDVEINKKGGAEFRFILEDDSGFDLSFKDGGPNAIFVAVGETCPDRPGNGGGEFVIAPKTSKDKAEMLDRTEKAGSYCYTLNFDSNDGEKNCDPIILNKV
jgi:hypothetical protein